MGYIKDRGRRRVEVYDPLLFKEEEKKLSL